MPDVDFSDLSKLAQDLGTLGKGGGEFVRKAVEVSARNVKDGWRGKLTGSEGLPHAARTIEYTLKGGNAIRGTEIYAEIGPRLGGQGSLVWVPEFGSLATAPRGYGRSSLNEEAEGFQKGVDLAARDAEKAVGL